MYRVDGGLPLDDLGDLIHILIDETEHQTVAGFIIELSERSPAWQPDCVRGRELHGRGSRW